MQEITRNNQKVTKIFGGYLPCGKNAKVEIKD